MLDDPRLNEMHHSPHPRSLYVFGAGGHGKVVADIAIQAGWRVLALLDDNPELAESTVLGLRVIVGRDGIEDLLRSDDLVALGIGSNAVRMRIQRELENRGIRVQTIISRHAVVSSWARIGRGTVVMPGAIVNAGAVIGDGVILNTGAVVEHDCEIGDFAHVSPNSTIGGTAKVGRLSQVAIGASVLPRVRVGARTILGAGSVATRDLPDDVIAYGVPARIRRRLSYLDPLNLEHAYKNENAEIA